MSTISAYGSVTSCVRPSANTNVLPFLHGNTQTINARFTVNTSPFAVWHSTNMIHPLKGIVPVIVHDLAGSTLFAFRLFLSVG